MSKVQNFNSLSFACLIASVFFLLACGVAEKVLASVEQPVPTFGDGNSDGNYFFNNYINNRQMPYAALRAKTPTNNIGGEPRDLGVTSSTTQEDYVCTVRSYKAAAEFDESILLNPTSQTFYPGALIKGESIENGQYLSFAVGNRSEVTISTSLEGIKEVKKNFTPTFSEFRQKKSDIENQEIEGTPSTIATYSIEEVTSREQFNLKMGAGANYNAGIKSGSIAANFDFDNMNKKSRFVVKLVQQYYTIDVDEKANAAAFFKDVNKLQSNFTMMPLYVASVKYGRMIYYTYESTEESSKMEAALRAAFSYGPGNGNINFESGQREAINTAKSSVTIIGGSSISNITAGVEGIKALINEGSSYSKDSRGAPIAYTLRSIKDGAVMKSLLASEYKVRNCEQVYSRFKLTVSGMQVRHVETDGWAEIYGSIWVRGFEAQDDGWLQIWGQGSSKTGGWTKVSSGEKGGYLPINYSRQYRFSNENVKNGSAYIRIDPNIYDSDSYKGSDDFQTIIEAAKSSSISISDLKTINTAIDRTYDRGKPDSNWVKIYLRIEPIPAEGI